LTEQIFVDYNNNLNNSAIYNNILYFINLEEKVINEERTSNASCLNGGFMHFNNSGYCICPPGFNGTWCETGRLNITFVIFCVSYKIFHYLLLFEIQCSVIYIYIFIYKNMI